MAEDKTVFIKVDDYEKIISKVKALNQHLQKAREQLALIKDLKRDEDSEILDWDKELETLSQKVEFVTETMSKQA